MRLRRSMGFVHARSLCICSCQAVFLLDSMCLQQATGCRWQLPSAAWVEPDTHTGGSTRDLQPLQVQPLQVSLP